MKPLKILKPLIILVTLFIAYRVSSTFGVDYPEAAKKHEFYLAVFGFALVVLPFVIGLLNAWEQKAESLQLQFEDKFFRLIEVQRKIRDEIDCDDEAGRGRRVFYYLFAKKVTIDEKKYEDVKELLKGSSHVYNAEEKLYEYEGFEKLLQDSSHNYETIKKLYDSVGEHSLLEHYFRHLYRVLRYVDDQKILSKTQKQEYIATFRAQLSEFELVYLYFNAIAHHNAYEAKVNANCVRQSQHSEDKACDPCNLYKSCKRFAPYIEKYALLDALPEKHITKKKRLDFFSKAAFPNIYTLSRRGFIGVLLLCYDKFIKNSHYPIFL